MMYDRAQQFTQETATFIEVLAPLKGWNTETFLSWMETLLDIDELPVKDML